MSELPAYATKAIQPLVDLLPSHAHIDQTARSWKAQWTTEAGLWIVHFRWPSLDPDEVTVTGPGLELKYDRPYGSDFVLAVLAQRGALMPPDEPTWT